MQAPLAGSCSVGYRAETKCKKDCPLHLRQSLLWLEECSPHTYTATRSDRLTKRPHGSTGDGAIGTRAGWRSVTLSRRRILILAHDLGFVNRVTEILYPPAPPIMEGGAPL